MCRHNSPQQLRFQPDYLRVTTDVIHKTGECYIGFSTNKPHARQSVGEVNGGQPGAASEEIVPHARHALLHHGGADGGQVVLPRLVARGEVGHVPRAADGERAVAGEGPDEVATVRLRAARALGHGRLPPCLHGGQAEGCQK